MKVCLSRHEVNKLVRVFFFKKKKFQCYCMQLFQNKPQEIFVYSVLHVFYFSFICICLMPQIRKCAVSVLHAAYQRVLLPVTNRFFFRFLGYIAAHSSFKYFWKMIILSYFTMLLSSMNITVCLSLRINCI